MIFNTLFEDDNNIYRTDNYCSINSEDIETTFQKLFEELNEPLSELKIEFPTVFLQKALLDRQHVWILFNTSNEYVEF